MRSKGDSAGLLERTDPAMVFTRGRYGFFGGRRQSPFRTCSTTDACKTANWRDLLAAGKSRVHYTSTV